MGTWKVMLNRTSSKGGSRHQNCCLCIENSLNQDDKYKCDACHRFICASCLDDLKSVGLEECPYCASLINQETIDLGMSLTSKSGIKSVEALKQLAIFYFRRKNWDLAKFFLIKVLNQKPSDKQAKSMYIEADFKIRSYY